MFLVRLVLGVLAFLLASFYGLGIALIRWDKRFVARDYARRLARWVDAALGIQVRVSGQESLRRVRPCVYISNHQNLPGAVEVQVLEPISTDSLTIDQVPKLIADTHRRMQAALTEMAARQS